jgi:biopolymer transport protein ExbD
MRSRRTLLDEEVSHEESDDRADLIPLIDCVFLVLLFYVVASTFVDEAAFPVELPAATAARQVVLDSPEQILSVWVGADGRVAVGEGSEVAEDYRAALRQAVTESGLKSLAIRGDKQAPYSLVAAIVDEARAAGIEEIAFAVDVSGAEDNQEF